MKHPQNCSLGLEFKRRLQKRPPSTCTLIWHTNKKTLENTSIKRRCTSTLQFPTDGVIHDLQLKTRLGNLLPKKRNPSEKTAGSQVDKKSRQKASEQRAMFLQLPSRVPIKIENLRAQ